MSPSRRSVLRAGFAAIALFPTAGILAAPAGSRKVRLSMPRRICQAKTEGSEDEIYLVVAGKTSQGRSIAGRIPSGHWDMDEGNPSKAEIRDISIWESGFAPGSVAEFTLFVMEEDESPASNPATLARAAAERTTVGGSLIGVKGDVEKLRSECFPHGGEPTIEVKKPGGNMEIFGMSTNIPRRTVSVGVSLYDTDDCPGIIGIRLTLDGEGTLTAEYASRDRCEDKGWVEAKVAEQPASPLIPKELIERTKQQELALLAELAKKPTRQFWCKGDGSSYRLFLRAELV